MNVFVLCTGRTASVAFAKACEHIENFSASHESRVQFLGEERINFPDQHIEVDNRLSWFMGKLDEKYGKSAFYVHLLRDREATARSFMQRWEMKGSIIHAYAENILMGASGQGEDICRDYVDTVNANIRHFLKDKPQQMTIHLEQIRPGFELFWQKIGAIGNLQAALAEFDAKHNPSLPTGGLLGKLKKRLKGSSLV
ncbi:MAG TPA: hypothetical protein PKA00_10095 [Saprospiraceae bacterium]|nr:hypothetical protein [Saprospiraceae bacterium]HMQ83249.1 hypothetical protein [Saprospiraceae bacterium]